MKAITAIGVVCCAAVIAGFPLYGLQPLPIFPQRLPAFPAQFGRGFGGLDCPIHGRVDGHHFGFEGDVHHDRFNQLGLFGYYGRYENLNDRVAPITSAGRHGIVNHWDDNNNFDNNFNNDRFDNNGFDNIDDGLLGNDDRSLGRVGPVLQRSFPPRTIQRGALPRVPLQGSALQPETFGSLPSAPIQGAEFPLPRDIPRVIVRDDFNDGPFNNFDNNGFNNDIGFIQDQISH